ncbi:uncharacterized protein PHALS_09754 [Plasmopara halstedii]|uniref:Uncharacterized protein n=1 Tax=Plasmopara halstedii TaxID=4781 RepID=A0A0P1AFG3_PLAHL|nr:uncharacterized protein PHALS_09754 [Plasmopara halstedii]CEG39511.1 hypothetical protein PHALS_09754 [Plasmopara halstedii]|eukprot:XP_024575880.1 hypothetical protein PHALS_09754 [Plasmopara halstedii]
MAGIPGVWVGLTFYDIFVSYLMHLHSKLEVREVEIKYINWLFSSSCKFVEVS